MTVVLPPLADANPEAPEAKSPSSKPAAAFSEEPGTGESFRASIQAFIKVAESNVPAEYSVPRLLSDFGFQKRRMYDVVGVLGSIGCCQKSSADSISWSGLSKIPLALLQMQRDAGADNPAVSLDQILGLQQSVSISRLTIGFFLCFLALREQTLDIKRISLYLSRRSGRNKSTLCKLYQIAHILEAAGVLARTPVPGQLTIVDMFFSPIELMSPQGDTDARNPYAIDSILNRNDLRENLIIQKRRNDFQVEFDRWRPIMNGSSNRK
jgi:hypothetical protein